MMSDKKIKNNEDLENEELEYYNQMEDWDEEDTPFGRHNKRIKIVEIFMILSFLLIAIFIEFLAVKTGDFLTALIMFIVFGSLSWLFFALYRRIKLDTKNGNSKEKI